MGSTGDPCIVAALTTLVKEVNNTNTTALQMLLSPLQWKSEKRTDELIYTMLTKVYNGTEATLSVWKGTMYEDI